MKIDIFHITEAEMEIMEQIWHGGKPVVIAELSRALVHKNWKTTTIHTLAGRLVKKGLLAGVRVSGKNLYLPCFSKEDYRFVVAKILLDKLFDGSFVKLAAILLKDMDLTGEALTELKDMMASAVLPAEEWDEIKANENAAREIPANGVAAEDVVEDESARQSFFLLYDGGKRVHGQNQGRYLPWLRDSRRPCRQLWAGAG